MISKICFLPRPLLKLWSAITAPGAIKEIKANVEYVLFPRRLYFLHYGLSDIACHFEISVFDDSPRFSQGWGIDIF